MIYLDSFSSFQTFTSRELLYAVETYPSMLIRRWGVLVAFRGFTDRYLGLSLYHFFPITSWKQALCRPVTF